MATARVPAGDGTRSGTGEFYILLCRHGPHRDGKLVASGEPAALPTEHVARALRDRLRYQSPYGDEPIRLRCVLHGNAPEVKETASVLLSTLDLLAAEDRNSDAPGVDATLQKPPILSCADLDESRFSVATGDALLTGWLIATAAGLEWGSPGARISVATGRSDGVSYSPRTAGNPGRWTSDLQTSELPAGNAVLVIGHQPHLGWLSDALLRRGRRWPWRSAAIPFGQAELACIAFRKLPTSPKRYTAARLIWTLAPDDRNAAEEVRAKIKSKMDTARTLSGVITFGLGALLGLLLDDRRASALVAAGSAGWVQLAVGLLLGGLVLYLAAMYAYDRLLMPDRFWAESRPRRYPSIGKQTGGPRESLTRIGRVVLDRGRRRWLVQRPPGSTAWVLYQNMMRVWRGLFTPATACVVGALVILAVEAVQLPLAIAAVAGLGLVALVYWFRPVLGSDD